MARRGPTRPRGRAVHDERPIPPVMIPKDQASKNEVVLTGKDIDLTKFPVPTFWPGDGGPFRIVALQ
jgi:UbiD family decarboxylase